MTYSLKSYYAGTASVQLQAEYLANLWLANKTPMDRLRFMNCLRRIRPAERRMITAVAVMGLVAQRNLGMASWLADWMENGERHFSV